MAAVESAQLRPTDVARALLRLWPRFIAAYLSVALLLYFCRPQISALVAHGARNLMLVLNPIPYIGEFSSTKLGYTISERFFEGAEVQLLDTNPLLFVVGFPLGFALALPGLRTGAYWRRVCWTFISSVGVCSLMMAVYADLMFVAKFSTLGIKIHASWHDEILRYVATSLWDLTIVLYPFLACLLLARTTFSPSKSGLTFAHSRTRLAGHPWLHRRSLAVLTALLLLLAIEFSGEHLEERPRREIFEQLAERNPRLGGSLIRYADGLAAQGRYRSALHWYREASTYQGYVRSSRARIRRILRKLEELPGERME